MKQTRPANSPLSGYQNLVVALLALLQFTIVLDFMILSPLGDILMKTLEISPSQFGIVVSCYAFSAGISGILAAGFADKYDRKKLLLFFYTGFIVGTFACALTTSYTMLLIARTITGLFGGVIGAISMAIITDLFATEQRGRVLGFVQMAFAASQVLGIPIGLQLANLWGWHSTFLMIIVLAAIIWVVVLLKLKPINAHLAVPNDKSPFRHLWHTVAQRPYRIGFLATAFLSIGGFMMMPFSSAFLINNIQITEAQLPLVFMFTGLASIVIMPLVGKLSDRVDKFKLFCAGSILAIIMINIYVNLSVIPLWEVVIINMVLFMGIMSRMIPSVALTTSIPDMKDRGAFMSINSSLQQMAGGVAAVCAGLIVTQETKTSPLQHYDILGIVVSVVMVICAVFVYRVSVIVKRKQEEKDDKTPVDTAIIEEELLLEQL
jgi:predicted MFS family arabinose efflux permease